MLDVIAKAASSHQLTLSEITALLETKTYDEALYAAADQVRKAFVGDAVHLRGLIEFSSYCARDCFYCGLRKDNRNQVRYRLTEEQVLEFAQKARHYGYRTVVLQSGEDPFYTDEMLERIIDAVKKLDLAVTLSIGEKERASYARYRAAGADRYLLRIETTDEDLYQTLHPGMSLDNRKRCLHDLRELGYELGTGGLVGLPGQSLVSIARDILFYQEINADMVGVGPFIPHGDTPLRKAEGGTFEMSRKVMAITRLLLPDSNIPATTAMESLNPNGRLLALVSGANVVMPNATEGAYRQWYQLYPGKICLDDTPGQCWNCMSGKVASIGRFVAKDYGFREQRSE